MNHQRTPTRSALAGLRAVIPTRAMHQGEALRVAELQANRLRQHFDIDCPTLPSDVIFEMPRIAVRVDDELPASGTTHWDGRRWIITLNGSESPLRRRFSLFHEFKHVIDHHARINLYGPDGDRAAGRRAEQAADYFAACALMPKRWVKRLWGEGTQSIPALADSFEVSTAALRFRLDQLGVREPTPRCGGVTSYQRFKVYRPVEVAA
jgi:Zn-dependent peptidase ImmA (M78 family)